MLACSLVEKDIAMGSFSLWHWAILFVIVLFLFGGRGRIASIMRDIGAGMGALKRGIGGDVRKEQLETTDDNS